MINKKYRQKNFPVGNLWSPVSILLFPVGGLWSPVGILWFPVGILPSPV